VNTQLRVIFYFFAAMFVALIGVLAYWQVYARESLANNPENGLQTQRAVQVPRGLITAADGTVLAESVQVGEDRYDREYPQGDLYAPVVGYWSTTYGATGIEIGLNTELSGSGEPATLDELINQLSGQPQAGNNVELTLDPELQELAYNELASSATGEGSAVALDPQTGEILALVSYPSYDPNGIDDNFPELQQAEGSPLLNRATQGLYIPGSIFKVITAAAALEAGVSPNETFVDTGGYVAGGFNVTNYGGASYGQQTFAGALARSINTIFAQLAVEEIGAQELAQKAREFGFGDDYEGFALPINASTLGEDPSQWDDALLASNGFGQGTVQTNVFQMALATAAIANEGTMMEPQIVNEIRSQDGIILDRATPQTRNRVMASEDAAALTDMMELVMTEGTAQSGQLPNVNIAGKTGTAETGSGPPHSWFVAFAPSEDPSIAVAVLVENGGDGETSALPIARNLIQAHLEGQNDNEQE
jgi:penicillin-binding protein A